MKTSRRVEQGNRDCDKITVEERYEDTSDWVVVIVYEKAKTKAL